MFPQPIESKANDALRLLAVDPSPTADQVNTVIKPFRSIIVNTLLSVSFCILPLNVSHSYTTAQMFRY